MQFCPQCGHAVTANQKFCPACGFALQQNQPAAQPQPANAASAPQTLYQSATSKLSHYAGEDGPVDVRLGNVFSEVFKPHTNAEAEELFISGTAKTTPSLSAVSTEWARPWLFSRVLLGFAIAFAALLYMAVGFDNVNAIPGLIMVGAFAVPFSGVIFFFEMNAYKNISLFDVVKIFFVGGVISLVLTVFLYQFVSFSDAQNYFGILTLNDALLIGVVEELGKVLVISYFISKLDTKTILNGILIGAAVGAGFAAFETAGYIYRAGDGLLEVAILRAWSAVGGHLAWGAMTGGALAAAKRDRPFSFNQLVEPRFLIFFGIAVALHAVWDWDQPYVTGYVLFVLLIVIAWIVIFSLISAGLKELKRLKSAGDAQA